MRAKIKIPPAIGVIAKGYLVIGIVMSMHAFGILGSTQFTILLVSCASMAMLFGVSYLLVGARRPIRKSGMDVPGLVLLYICGTILLYFVSLLGSSGILMPSLSALLITAIALALAVFGVGAYVVDVVGKAFPVSRRPVRRYHYR
ncbi:MAG: hypothetical protein HZB92_05975 [Euryarchaeota archaeon]|nr:hypothetical protein [Euryarchaeota archaeon]